MSRKVYFIRHGDVEFPLDKKGRKLIYPPETPLSILGRRQIHQVAEQLKKEGIRLDALFSSPFKRARESANMLLEELSIPKLIIVNDLHDVHPNSWTGRPLEEYAKIEGDIYSHALSQDQETLEQLLIRAKRALELVMGTENFSSVGVISHGDLLSGADWVLRTPDRVPSYIEMKNNFYLQKGQVAEYKIDPSLRIVDEVRLVTVPEVLQSIEGWRSKLERS